jgi:hypothetical protein
LKQETITQILTLLSTMKGYPSFPIVTHAGADIDAIRLTYISVLAPMPDALGDSIRREVLLRFDERPSVKDLVDWARSLGPMKTFAPSYLRMVDTAAPRTAGNGLKQIEAPANGEAAFPVSACPPAEAKAIMARIKARMQSDKGIGGEGSHDFGLQFEILPGFKDAGRVNRTQPSMSKTAAEGAALDRNTRWPHQHTSIFKKGDPQRSLKQSQPSDTAPMTFNVKKAAGKEVLI